MLQWSVCNIHKNHWLVIFKFSLFGFVHTELPGFNEVCRKGTRYTQSIAGPPRFLFYYGRYLTFPANQHNISTRNPIRRNRIICGDCTLILRHSADPELIAHQIFIAVIFIVFFLQITVFARRHSALANCASPHVNSE